MLGLAFKADTDDERDSLAHKLVRLLERELADVVVHDPHVADADAPRSRTPCSTPTPSSSPPTTREFRGRGVLRAIADSARRDAVVADPWDTFGAAQVFGYAAELAGALARDEPRRVLVTGGAGTIGAAVVRRLLDDDRFTVRVSDQREPPRTGCARAARSTPATCATLDEARQATAGCSHVIHLAAIVGGIANFHKLPYTLTEVNAALYNGVVRAALEHDVERFTYVSSSMVFERATEYPTTEEHIWECPMPRSAYGFSKLTGEVYVRAAHDEHGLPYTICRPFNAYGPGEMPEDEPGIAHAVPDLIRKCLGAGARARRCRSSATARTRAR